MQDPVTEEGKNIVLCSDGTGNSGGKGHGTNVWRLFNAVDQAVPVGRDEDAGPLQIAFYDDGVGTQRFKLLKLFGGAFGFGLSRNIRELYTFLVNNYQPNDRIFLFGFSRGAFTVRSLSGLIHQCGIIDLAKVSGDGMPNIDQVRKAVRRAFRAYRWERWKKRNFLLRLIAKIRSADRTEAIRDELAYPDSSICCIGVWDTVDAIGVPQDSLRWVIDKIFCVGFHEHDLSPVVKRGFHALSIDDERQTFHPVMWDEKLTVERASKSGEEQKIEQVWFPGVHSNVGGGYPRQGMAFVSLDWMMDKAEDCKLRFKQKAREEIHNGINPHDLLYDSRSGFAAYYRYGPRDIDKICDDNGMGTPKVHVSAFERIGRATLEYAPGNLPFEISLVGVSTLSEEELRDHLRELKDLQGISASSLRSEHRGLVRARSWLHMLFVTLTMAVVVGVYLCHKMTIEAPGPHGLISRGFDSVFTFAATLLPEFLRGFLGSTSAYFQLHPGRLFMTAIVFIVLFAVRWLLHKGTDSQYEAFWAKARLFVRNRRSS